MRRLAALVLLAACDAPMTLPDGGMDGGAADAGPAWTRLCDPTRVAQTPVSGEDRFCPAIHDYVRTIGLDGGAHIPDAWLCPDGATQCECVADGGTCARPDVAWAVLHDCPWWVRCDLGLESPCYHCPTWGPHPWSL